MSEDWQTHWEDYYRILQVDPSAEPEVIAAAYKKLTAKYHPDHNPNADANEKTKKINVAYGVLSDPAKRKTYDELWFQKKSGTSNRPTARSAPQEPTPPKPIVEPKHIRLHDVDPRQTQTFSYTIQNLGGSYKKLRMQRSEWLRIVSSEPLTDRHALPMKVIMSVEGIEWDKKYNGSVAIYLDNEDALLTIEIETIPEPFNEKVKRFMAKHKKKVALAITIPLTILILQWIVPIECPQPYGQSTGSETGVIQDTILGRWEWLNECPPNLTPEACTEFKKLQSPFLLEFLENDRLLYICEEGTRDGKYSLINQDSMQITWSSYSKRPVGFHFYDGKYEVRFFGDKIGLRKQGNKEEVTFRRVE